MENQLVTRIYAGFLGMNIGIRLGAPVEPGIWTFERIARTYGEITDYVKAYKHFAADDDANGPVMFLRALDDTNGQEPTPASVAEAYVNYTREGIGMFWWGGLGVSTEHTAYINLTHGVPAPQSGSIRQNGQVVAEQIGGQIFIDTWGLVAPGDEARAARYARAAASVSHDGEGLHGAAFIAACIAAAFDAPDIEAVIERGLAQIPKESLYAAVVRAVLAFHRENPGDWRACRMMLEEKWGYDRYPGACHIIPNAGVCALSLVYGQGNFARTVEIATMSGWDTDCNAGNVGTVAGVLAGIDGIPMHYRKPINDEIVLSSASGYLNILDIPTYAWYLAQWAYRLRGEAVPEEVRAHLKPGEIHFDFALPGSTHGLCTSDPCATRLSHRDGGLEVMWDSLLRGQQVNIYHKPFYRRADFSDERYMPVFSPLAYPGQQAAFRFAWERLNGESICVNPYVRDAVTGKMVLLDAYVLREEGEQAYAFTLPQTESGLLSEIGLMIEGNSPRKTFDAGRLIITSFSVSGKADYTIPMARMPKEWNCVLPFSHNHGSWNVEDGMLYALAIDRADAMTGNYFTKDVRVSARVCPLNGESHLLSARVQGTLRGYYAGLHGEREAAILANRHGKIETLASAPFDWSVDRQYLLTFVAKGDSLCLFVDGKEVLTAKDAELAYGMVGFSLQKTGRTRFGDLHVEEIGR